MIHIQIRRLDIQNFQGIDALTIDFGLGKTDILGANGVGKTTVRKSIAWLVSGKDENGKTKFEIRKMGTNGEAKRVDSHSVVATFEKKDGDKDPEIMTFCRTAVQKWTKPRGVEEEVYNGLTTSFVINGKHTTSDGFNGVIGEYFRISAANYLIISNPLAFGSLPWEKQRDYLEKMAGNLDIEMPGTSLPDLKRRHGSTKTEIGRYEGSISLSDPKDMSSKEKRIFDIEKIISLESDHAEHNSDIEFQIKTAYEQEQACMAQKNDIERQLISLDKLEVAPITKKVIALLNAGADNCYTCSESYNILTSDLKVTPDELAKNKEDCKISLSIASSEILGYQNKQKDLAKRKIEPSKQLTAFIEERDALKAEVLVEKIQEDKRRTEIKEKKELGSLLAELEQQIIDWDSYSTNKAHALQLKVNSLFGDGVSFKLFNKQVNEHYKETCEVMRKIGDKDVPWGSLSTSEKIKTGLEIIRAISEYLGYTHPVWIDNKESISHLPKLNSQLISLIVDSSATELKIIRL